MLVVFLPIFPPKDKMYCVHLAEVGLSLFKSEDIMQLHSYMLFIYLQLTDVKLFLALQTWDSPIVKGEGPEAREGHSAAVVGKCLFIFGGFKKSADNDNEAYYNDLYILNTGEFPLSYCEIASY